MRLKLILIGVLFGISLGYAQRNTKYGQYAYKILPISVAYYSIDDNSGIRLGIENSFYDRPLEWVDGIEQHKSLWQVVGILGLSTLWKETDNGDASFLYGGSYQMGWRKSFSNTLKIEAFTGYQYLRSSGNSATISSSDFHLWDLTIGVGQDFKMVRESFITWYLRPGLNFEIESSGLSFYSTSIQVGIDYRFENIHLKPWKNPWFKPKDKTIKGKEFQRPNLNVDEDREDKKTKRLRIKKERKERRKRKKRKVNLGMPKYKTGKW